MFQRLKEKIQMKFQADSIPEAVGVLAFLAADITCVTAVVVGWILFIVGGGYADQAAIVGESGIFSFEQLFTKGTAGIFYVSPAAVIEGIALAAAFLACFVCFYRYVGIARRIIMSVLIVLAAGIGGSVVYLERLSSGAIPLTEEQAVSFQGFLQRLGMEDVYSLMTALVAAGVIMSVIIFIFTAFSRAGLLLKYILLSALFCFGAAPLVLLFLENIIPLFLFAVILAVIFLVLKLITRGADSAGAGSAAGSFDRGVSGQGNDIARQESNAQIKRVDSGCKVFRGETVLSGKGIFSYNGLSTAYLCSQSDYDKGKVRVVDCDKGDRDHSPVLPGPPQGAQPASSSWI